MDNITHRLALTLRHIITNKLALLLVLLIASLSVIDVRAANSSTAASTSTPTSKTDSTSPNVKPTQRSSAVVIESEVTGSQEQPKVIYIMPWQGITNPVQINNQDFEITLPQLQPINPKRFKQQVIDYNASSAPPRK